VIRSERGDFTLVGLLMAMALLTIVLAATTGAFAVFQTNVNDTQARVEATDRARNASDMMARQLRNLATPTALQPNAVVLASATDVIFETVSPSGTPTTGNPQNIQFVRYCLDAPGRRLWTMEIPAASVTANTVAPSGGSCPASGWSNARVVASDIVNVYGVKSRPVFAFDNTTLNLIRRATVDLYVDTTPGRSAAEQQVVTGVDLRNQDAAPTAAFTYTLAGGGIVALDGTSSSDPDNDPLDFCWYDAQAPSTTTAGTCGPHSVGDTPTVRYRTTAQTPHAMTLTVTDPSGLSSTSPAQTFTSK
jgi:type II secretory pathway pseudopilin PulG